MVHRNPLHRVTDPVPPQAPRGHAAARGYTYRWQQYTKRFLLENPFCIVCAAPSRCTDHIIPVLQDGSDESAGSDELFWEWWNHQPLCKRCHRLKTDAHDARLKAIRKTLLGGIPFDEIPEDDWRNELIRRSGIWPQWYDLETGRLMSND